MIHVPAASEYSLLITGSINLDLTTYVGITYKEWCSQFGDTSSKTYCSAPEPTGGPKIGHQDNSIRSWSELYTCGEVNCGWNTSSWHDTLEKGIPILYQRAKPGSSCLSPQGIFTADGHTLLAMARRSEAYLSVGIYIRRSSAFA